MRGKALDLEMEKELQIMLLEGSKQSPISSSTLHARLKAKGLVNSGLNLFSKPHRKDLINRYRLKQSSINDNSPEILNQNIGRNSKLDLISKNKELVKKIDELEDRLARNSTTIIEIAKYIQMHTNYSVASLLESHLIRELRGRPTK